MIGSERERWPPKPLDLTFAVVGKGLDGRGK